MYWAIGRISRAAEGLPVTADIESGYGLSADEHVERLLTAGAVGCNLEDTDHSMSHALRDADEQADRLRAVKRAAATQGVDLVLNARVDVFLRGDPDLDEAIRRALLYVEAGADCVFPIGAPDEASITALVKAIPVPVNVIAGFRGAPDVSRLRDLGVRRISYAGRLFCAAIIEHERRLQAVKRWESI
jgi:2-methylisocitrate lyase-like PEP mutase family enzyme